jgi:ribosomal-protein-alanine N-acetyltransferase
MCLSTSSRSSSGRTSVQLSTNRLLLREYVESDWQSVLEYQRDSRYLRFYAWNDRTEADVRAFVQAFIDAKSEQPRVKYSFAVTLKTNGQLIGNCNLRKNQLEDRVAEIGYEIAPAHWGKGYATEAARAIVAFGFDELKLHRIAAWCITENTASVRVLEKLGMRLEGRLREQEWLKGRWWDALLYSILEHEWNPVGE